MVRRLSRGLERTFDRRLGQRRRETRFGNMSTNRCVGATERLDGIAQPAIPRRGLLEACRQFGIRLARGNQQHLLFGDGVIGAVHGVSGSRMFLSLIMALCMRPSAVLSGQPTASAISLNRSPPKYRSSTTSR